MLASSLPWLLPPVIGDLRIGERAHAPTVPAGAASLGEKLRRAGDFEHWAAFYQVVPAADRD